MKRHKAKEKPVLFGAEMVRAIMECRKTQTRRIINKLNGFGDITEFKVSDTRGYDWTFRNKRMLWNDLRHDELMAACPWGKPGERLWVREAWQPWQLNGDPAVLYRADKAILPCEEASKYQVFAAELPWKPSIHMPRWACRLMLEITGIRVERIQDISEDDAIAEGCKAEYHEIPDSPFSPGEIAGHSAFEDFASLWHEAYPDSWDRNDWVWVIDFKKVGE